MKRIFGTELLRRRDNLEYKGKSVGSQVCQICGDNIGVTDSGNVGVACDVCALPVCRPCYQYDHKNGNQSCQARLLLETKRRVLMWMTVLLIFHQHKLKIRSKSRR
nr:cellulose synthase A catalytic subunit 3 [UDP-forming] [Tanacetum cinerariifolium]